MGVYVPPESRSISTFVITESTGEGTFITMSELVTFEVTASWERLSTYFAGEWFFPCVCAHVFSEIAFLTTFVITVTTGQRLFTCMNVHVSF